MGHLGWHRPARWKGQFLCCLTLWFGVAGIRIPLNGNIKSLRSRGVAPLIHIISFSRIFQGAHLPLLTISKPPLCITSPVKFPEIPSLFAWGGKDVCNTRVSADCNFFREGRRALRPWSDTSSDIEMITGYFQWLKVSLYHLVKEIKKVEDELKNESGLFELKRVCLLITRRIVKICNPIRQWV